MVYSMTGFGRAEYNDEQFQIAVEVKTLNGRNFEVISRFSSWLRPFEIDIRSQLKQSLHRGTIDCMISFTDLSSRNTAKFNHHAALDHYNAYQELAKALGWKNDLSAIELLLKISTLPEVNQVEQHELSSETILKIQHLLAQALQKVNQHRLTEGTALANELRNYTHQILSLLEKVEPYEIIRNEQVRSRVAQAFEQWEQKEKLDEHRFEQELLHYLERLDISEEKQRLITHCQYFLSLLDEGGGEGIGKKLGFMSQEMGREINTLGSKANDVNIQKIVVQMKDVLEKIKEQILNVL